MEKNLLIIIVALIIINIGFFVYGKYKVKKINKTNTENTNYGIKYMLTSVVISFLTIIILTIIAFIKLIG